MQSGMSLFTRDCHVLTPRRPRRAGKEQSEVDQGPWAPESSDLEDETAQRYSWGDPKWSQAAVTPGVPPKCPQHIHCHLQCCKVPINPQPPPSPSESTGVTQARAFSTSQGLPAASLLVLTQEQFPSTHWPCPLSTGQPRLKSGPQQTPPARPGHAGAQGLPSSFCIH